MAAGSDENTEDEWRFSLDELDDEAEPAGSNEDDEDGNIAGTLAHDQPLEPGEIDLENALFVLAGILLVVGLLAATLLGL